MRITVNLEPDVGEQVREFARLRNLSFGAALNRLLRAGLDAERGQRRPYKVVPYPMGVRPGVDLTHALRLAYELEDEETIRKMNLQE